MSSPPERYVMEPELYEKKPRCDWRYDPDPWGEVRSRRHLVRCVYVLNHEGPHRFEECKVIAAENKDG